LQGVETQKPGAAVWCLYTS